MPKFSKKTISDYFRTSCDRYLALSLYRTDDENKYQMPTPIIARKSQKILGAAGKEAEQLIYELLHMNFEDKVINFKNSHTENLKSILHSGLDNQLFLLEPTYSIEEIMDSFFNLFRINTSTFQDQLDMAAMRPDIIYKITDTDSLYHEVLPNGELKEISPTDSRTKLGIIDIKNTELSNTGYDAEVVLYAMLLSLWIRNNDLGSLYVITDKLGIFPGVFQVNAFTGQKKDLSGVTIEEKYKSFLDTVSYVEFDQLAITLKKVIQETIPNILQKPEDWEELHWHVGKKCSLCDWLGFSDWLGAADKEKVTSKHCFTCSNINDHLCQVPFITRGMTSVLKDSSISTVQNLSNTSGTEKVYNEHTGLKKNSSLLPKRAKAIHGNPSIEKRTITSLPYSFTNIFVTLNFDASTGITSSIGLHVHWREYAPFGYKGEYNTNSWDEHFFTETPDIEGEGMMIDRFLFSLLSILKYADNKENNTHPDFKSKKTESQTYQMYFWDYQQFQQLQKTIGIHLGSIIMNKNFKALVWLFPPSEVLEDAYKVSQPISFIKDILRTNIALSVPYEYTLFNVARSYLKDPTIFNRISKAFYDPFSDAIPKDRLYEIWGKTTRPNYQEVLRKYTDTTKKQVLALYLITNKLRQDLRGLTKGKSRSLDLSVFNDFSGITRWAVDSKLWYLHSLLNERYEILEANLNAFTPAIELESAYKAIILNRYLQGKEKDNIAKEFFPSLSNIEIFCITENSKNSKIKDDETWLSFFPVEQEGFAEQKLSSILHSNGVDSSNYEGVFQKMGKITMSDIVGLDRDSGYIALRFHKKEMVRRLQEDGILSLNDPLCLIKLSPFLSSKYAKGFLKEIKNPQIAHADTRVLNSLGMKSTNVGKSAIYTISRVLWDANTLSMEDSDISKSDASHIIDYILSNTKSQLNQSQKKAIITSLSKRLNIIWGPPGTGKTKTASLLLAARVEASNRESTPLRALLTAPTYQACIELYSRCIPLLKNYSHIETFALQSQARTDFEQFKDLVSNLFLLNGSHGRDHNHTHHSIRMKLLDSHTTEIIIILAPLATLNNFLSTDINSKNEPIYNNIGKYFDYVMLDEASQVDVASSLGSLFGLTKNAQLTLIGDHLQMPPIHKVAPPAGIEFMVGSILEYLQLRFEIAPSILNINYRSCQKIVDFIKTVGYPELTAHNQVESIPYKEYPNHENPFSSMVENGFFSDLLDIDKETIAITYEDGRNSQANEFEACLIAGAIIEAYHTFDSSHCLEYEKWFWTKAIGIVTPHKAQKMAISRKLYSYFHKNYHKMISEAIDTVERFQGSQRKVVIISFGVGDPDIIAQEEEFLLNLNRTNVAISRAELKVIVFISENLIHHLPLDKEIIQTARAIKSYTYQYCNKITQYLSKDKSKEKLLNFRYR